MTKDYISAAIDTDLLCEKPALERYVARKPKRGVGT
jgi:hypothetical protein